MGIISPRGDMKLYHVLVTREDRWLIGRVLEKEGITTQGRSLDELVFMVRDAIKLMWNEKSVQLELVVPGDITPSGKRRALTGRQRIAR
jgi:hypothetical protein